MINETHHLLARRSRSTRLRRAVRAKLLNGATLFSYDRGEYDQAEALATEARALCQELGDAGGAAFAQSSLGFIAYFRGDYDRAAVLLDEGLTLARAAHDPANVARALNNLGVLALARGELEKRPRALRGEPGALAAASERWSVRPGPAVPRPRCARAGGSAAGDGPARGERGAGTQDGYACCRRSLYLQGQVARSLGQHARATALFQESLIVRREQGDRRGIAECFEGLAASADAGRKPTEAARLLGAADAQRAAIGAPLPRAPGRPGSGWWPG